MIFRDLTITFWNQCRQGLLRLALIAGVVMFVAAAWYVRQPVEASSRKAREAGAMVFHEKGCEHCHGVNGVGTDKGPDLGTIGKRWKRTQIEQQIHDGGNGMPAFGDVLQPDEVDLLVEYLSAKRKAAKP